jgi:hypothetical protein
MNKDRYISKMFLCGNLVILVVSNPVALAGAGGGGGLQIIFLAQG